MVLVNVEPVMTGEIGSGNDRSKFIGGSDVAAIIGVSPWKTPVQIWQEKTGRITPAERDDAQRDKAKLFSRGHRWEQPAFEMLCDELRERGHKVELVATSARYVDSALPFMACEIDREILFDDELINVEVKTVHPFAQKKWGEADTDEVPIEYAAQAMHGLGIRQRRLCIVGCLIGADTIVPYFIKRDEETILAMRQKLAQFWTEHVLKDIPPDPINFQDLSILYPRDNGLEKEATEEVAELVKELTELKRINKINSERADELEFQIQTFMQPAATLNFNGRKLCTWKSQTSHRFDQKAFSKAFPDQYEKFKRPSESRVFRLANKQER